MEEDNFYCKKCGGCGYIGCCGIRSFLKHHVEGKTDCPNEYLFIQEIIDFVEDSEDFKINFPDGDKTKLNKNYKKEFFQRGEDGELHKVGETNIGREDDK